MQALLDTGPWYAFAHWTRKTLLFTDYQKIDLLLFIPELVFSQNVRQRSNYKNSHFCRSAP